MINKNREEIEKLYNQTKECEKNWKSPYDNIKWSKRNADWFMSRWCYFERIKTSILWCEDEIEYLEELCSYAEDEDNMQLINTIEPKLEQLQIHLKWLKEQEQTE